MSELEKLQEQIEKLTKELEALRRALPIYYHPPVYYQPYLPAYPQYPPNPWYHPSYPQWGIASTVGQNTVGGEGTVVDTRFMA